jgi:hypothetical protein
LKGKLMKLVLCVLVFLGSTFVASAQTSQDIQRYSYHLWGTVLDEESRIMPHLTVCFLPSERPINGRIPCTKTGDDGTFAMTVKDIPDKYNVCASTTDSPFVLVGEDPSHRVSCSKRIEFGANTDCRKVDLKFETGDGHF